MIHEAEVKPGTGANIRFSIMNQWWPAKLMDISYPREFALSVHFTPSFVSAQFDVVLESVSRCRPQKANKSTNNVQVRATMHLSSDQEVVEPFAEFSYRTTGKEPRNLLLFLVRCSLLVGSFVTCITSQTYYSTNQEVGNQTTRRREGGVGRWVLAVRLEKRHPISRLPQRRDRLFPYIEHPTDNSTAGIGIFIAPREGGSVWKWALPTIRPGGGLGIEGSLERWPSHWSNVFLPTSWYELIFFVSPPEGGLDLVTNRKGAIIFFPLFTDLTCAQRTRVHFCPQHWLLCHLGLY